jgi:hypothetical protein
MEDQSYGGHNSPPPPEVSWSLKYKLREWIENRNSNGAVLLVSVVAVIITELT